MMNPAIMKIISTANNPPLKQILTLKVDNNLAQGCYQPSPKISIIKRIITVITFHKNSEDFVKEKI